MRKWLNTIRSGRASIPLVVGIGAVVLTGGLAVPAFLGSLGVTATMATSAMFMAGAMLGTILFAQKSKTGEIPSMASYPVQRSNKGTPIEKIYGTARKAGNVLWMGENHPWVQKESAGGKGGSGGSQVTDQGNRRSFLIGICEGPATVLRMWRGKDEIDLSNATFFTGDGNSGIPALTGEVYTEYPNLCCVFFDETELGTSTALPNYTFEVTSFTTGKIGITTPQQLQDMQNDTTADYELLTDIDMTGFDWTPVADGTPNFSGSLDGNYHTISNLTFTHTAGTRTGIFGRISNGTVQNLLLSNFEIHAEDIVGCLAGSVRANSVISRVGATGSIFLDQNLAFGGSQAGGLIGGTSEIGGVPSIVECWANVNITCNYSGFQDHSIGGLIGDLTNNITVTDCWAGGSIILANGADTPVQEGGLAGDALQSNGQITRCLSYCDILTTGQQVGGGDDDVSERIGGFLGRWSALGPPIDCHWDTDVSGVTWHAQGVGPPDDAAEPGILGHTTAVMYQEATYTNWDFENIWEIDEGNGYPTLQWVNLATTASDENPAVLIKDLLTNDRYGAGIDESTWIDTDSFDAVETFCDANGLRFSFVIDAQKPILDWIDFINSHYQGYLYMSEGKIHLGIFKSEDNVFTLTQDNLVVDKGENPPPPVSIKKRTYSETFNRVEIAWKNRGKNYDTSIAIAQDEVDQRVSGKIRKKTIQLIGITNADLAQATAYKILFDSMYRFSIYNFTLSYQDMLLEVGDVGTLSDGFLITAQKIRMTSIEEDKDGRGLRCEAVEDKSHVYETFSYTTQDSDRVEDSAPTLASPSATFTEDLTESALAISIAPGGADTNGWHIYRSYDDSSFSLIGQANIVDATDETTNSTGATTSPLVAHPTVEYDGVESFLVNIGTITDLDTAITDASFFNNQRLCKIGNEIIAYKTCVETETAGIWRITGLIRGLFGTEAIAHAVGSTFFTVNIDFTYLYQDADVGRTLYFKFLTFHGNSIQEISDVSSVSYVVSGKYKRPLPVSLMRIQDREGLLTYETDDVVVSFYFGSKTAGFNLGGHGDVLWDAYEPDPSIKTMNVKLKETDETLISENDFDIFDIGEPMAVFIEDADRDGNNPYVVEIKPGSSLSGIGSRELQLEQV